MKKILAIVLAALMVLSLAGCGSSGLDADKLSEIMSAIESIQSTLDSMQAAAPAEEAAEAPAEEAPAEAPAEEAPAAEESAEGAPVVLIPPVLTGAHLADILLSACGIEGYDFPYGETYYDTITAVNTVGFEKVWSMGDDNPAAEYKTTDGGNGEKTTVDFTWNGQKEVWSVLPTTGAEGLVLINDAMGAVMEGEGFTYVKKDAQGDPTAQVQFIEDAIAAGNVGAIMCAAMSVEMLEDVVLQALDAGIAVAYLGAEPTTYGISGCVYTAYEITGMYAVEAAEDWVANSGADVPTNADGKYEVAADTYYDIQDGVYRSNAVIGTIEKSDSLVCVSETSSYGQSAYTDAYNNASDVLNAHPDCHIFIAYEPEEAMGAADAIADYCDVNGLSVADYFVAPCYAEDSTFSGMYEEAAADASANAIKGYATYGDPVMMAGPEAQEFVGAGYDALVAFAAG